MRNAAQSERIVEPCRWPTFESVGENLREARAAVKVARDVAENAVGKATMTIKRHPLRYVSAALGAGVIAGALVGFGTGWAAGRRC